MYVSDQFFFKASNETLKLQKKSKKNAFTSKL